MLRNEKSTKVKGCIVSGFYQGEQIRIKADHNRLGEHIYEHYEEKKGKHIYLYSGSTWIKAGDY